jgi:hypothetical protein
LALAWVGFGATYCKTPEGPTVVKGDETGAGADSSLEGSMAQFLEQFEQDSRTAMNQHVVKRNAQGQEVTPWREADRQDANYSQQRRDAQLEVICFAGLNAPQVQQQGIDAECKEFLKKVGQAEQNDDLVQRVAGLPTAQAGAQAPIELYNDNPARLIDNGSTMVQTLEDMEAKSLKKAALAVTPWSDYYWATYKGFLGYRYTDPNFPDSDRFKDNYDYALKNRLRDVVASGDQTAIDNLSPGEKYDLLLGGLSGLGGQSSGHLTSRMWASANRYADAQGNVETWMGLCHGWAPAAYMMARPAQTIKVRDQSNRFDINFYPSDIKALSTTLWANGRSGGTRFIGGRCNSKDPETDASGRIRDQECFDNNPGSWHMAVINQIGVAKRSFVMDATYDYQVWNQPVYSYEYKYFNPQTLKPSANLQGGRVALPFAGDKFASYRSPNAKYVVGVGMRVSYIVETGPSHSASDSPADDAITSADYRYDLELDANGKIIGGEWYQNEHPDFLWTFPPNQTLRTSGDAYASGTWDGKSPLPSSWIKGAKQDARYSIPMGKIVYALTARSAQP